MGRRFVRRLENQLWCCENPAISSPTSSSQGFYRERETAPTVPATTSRPVASELDLTSPFGAELADAVDFRISSASAEVARARAEWR
jgi:hypothetical protein